VEALFAASQPSTLPGSVQDDLRRLMIAEAERHGMSALPDAVPW
jgi:hypothetical protein